MLPVLHKLKTNNFFISVFTIGSGNLIAQIISIITIPMISRVYSSQSYGEYGIILSTSAIIISFAALGLSSAIMAPANDEACDKVFMTSFYLQTFVSTVFVVIFIVISPIYLVHNVSGSYYISIFIMYIYILLTGFKNIMIVYVNRKGMNKVLFVNPMIGATGNLLVALPLGYLGYGYKGLLIAIVISEIVMCTQMAVRVNPFRVKYSYKDFVETVKTYKKYVIFQSPSNLIGSIAAQFPAQYLSRVFDNTILGGYVMSVKLLKYPISFLAAPISIVYFRTISEHVNKGLNFADFTYKMVTSLMLIAIAPMFLIIFFGETLFSFVLGSEWAEAGRLASILILQYVLMFCSECTGYCRVSLGKQDYNLYYTIVDLATTILFSLTGYFLYRNVIGTITFLSIGKSLVYVLDMALNFYCMKKNMGKYLRFSLSYIAIVFIVLVIKTGI